MSESQRSRLLPVLGIVLALIVGAGLRLVWPGDMEYKADEIYSFERTQRVGVTAGGRVGRRRWLAGVDRVLSELAGRGDGAHDDAMGRAVRAPRGGPDAVVPAHSANAAH